MTTNSHAETRPQKVLDILCVYIKNDSLENLKLLCHKLKTGRKKYGTPLLGAMQCHLRGEPSICCVDIFNPQ